MIIINLVYNIRDDDLEKYLSAIEHDKAKVVIVYAYLLCIHLSLLIIIINSFNISSIKSHI